MARKAGQRAKGSGTLELRGRIWFARWTVGGKTFKRSTELSDKKEAIKKLEEFVAPFRMENEKAILETMTAKLGGVDTQIQRYEDSLPATTIKNGWAEYFASHKRPDSGAVTLSQYEGWYEAFAKWAESKYPEAVELRNVGKEISSQYASHLQSRVSATTFNRHINTLSLVWRILKDTAKIGENPWQDVTKKRFIAHSRRELTVDELGRIINMAKGEMRLLIALGIYTGLRLGDCACLRWDNIDMVKRLISVIPMKTARRTQKRVVIPIHPVLLNLMEEVSEKQRKGFLLPGCEARYHQFNAALAKDVAKLFQAVGLETKAKIEGVKRRRPDAGFHSLRHTFVSLCAAGGVPQSVVQALVGHGSPAMTQYYTHIGIATAKSAIDALPSVTGSDGQLCAAAAQGGELQGVLTKLDSLTEDELRQVGVRVKELKRRTNVCPDQKQK